MARVMDRNSEPDLREVLLTKIHTKKTPKMQKDFAWPKEARVVKVPGSSLGPGGVLSNCI